MKLTCVVCGQPRHPQATLCRRCKRLRDRIELRAKPDFAARQRALAEHQAFLCHYTRVPLTEVDPSHDRYPVFDHRTPRKESDVVVCANLINRMKTDLDEAQFEELVLRLAELFRGKRARLQPSDFRD
ncbi:MAG: hypothetical protein U0228_29835 [Myxococcaceae bacterium]